MNNEQETVTVSIPAPPKGWRVDGFRNVSAEEYAFIRGKWVLWQESPTTLNKYPCAIREQSEAEKRGLEVGCCYAGQWDADGTYSVPSMLIETTSGYDYLQHRFGDPEAHDIAGLRRDIEWRKVFDADGNPCEVDENGELLAPIEDEKPEPEYEEMPVVACDYHFVSGGHYLHMWGCRVDFAGAVYEHPNGHRKVFGFAHPIFVRAASKAAIWDWSHAETKQHTHMIRPVAIRRKVAK